MKPNCSQRPGVGERGLAAATIVALVGFGALEGARAAEPRVAVPKAPPEADTSAKESKGAKQWKGLHWRVRAERLRRGPGWIVAEEALARSSFAGETGGWQLRADRLVAWLPRPGRIGALLATGSVRIVGASPVYAAGSRAVSFRPARSIGVRGRTNGAELLGDGWQFRGRRIDIDLRRRAATVVAVGRR